MSNLWKAINERVMLYRDRKVTYLQYRKNNIIHSVHLTHKSSSCKDVGA